MRKSLISILVFSINVFAQYQSPHEYVSTSWGLDDGLPQSTVNNILQTSDGYIWLASFGGLIRFDGVKFTLYNRFNSPGMLSDRVLNLFEDGQGRLWIGTEKGLVCYDRSSKNNSNLFKTYTTEDGLTNNVIVGIAQDKQGNIWVFPTGDNFNKLVNGRFIQQYLTYDADLKMRAINGDGEYLHSQNKIIRLIDDKLVHYVDASDFTNSNLWDVKEDADGTLYIATNGDGIFILNPRFPDKIKHLSTSNGLLSNYIRKTLLDKAGNLWAVGSGGINQIDLKNNYKIYNAGSNEQITSTVLCAFQDTENNYWFGTETEGLLQLERAAIKTFGADNGIKKEILLSLFRRENGTLLIATNCGGIYELKNDNINFSYLNKYLINTCVWSIFEDSKKRIWIGAQDLIVVDGNKATYFSPADGFNSPSIFAIYEDKNGTIWVGTGTGLFRYQNNKFIQYTVKDGLTDDEVRSIYEDSKGNLWIGTVSGLNKMRDGKIYAYQTIKDAQSSYIRAIHEDKDGILWFGSYGGGLIRLKNNQFRVFTTKDGLFDNIVSHIVEDKYGYFWMGCNRGISRVSRETLNNYADGKVNFLKAVSYGKHDGMESVETNGGFQPNAVIDKEGMIYFPTVKGLAVINPDDVKINNLVPPVYIEKFIVNDTEKPQVLYSGTDNSEKTNFEMPYDSSDIQIEYSALSFTNSKDIKFKYKLIGFDENWNDAGKIRFANYRRLPPGDYTFTVIARNNAGVWNEKGASVAFTIVPPFWMTWWFRSVIILSFILIGPMVYYRRIKVLKREQQLQHEFSEKLINNQEQERSRIAQELHDSLGQELLLIKNRAMLGLKNLEDETKAKKQLEYISDSAASAINQVRHISHNLRPPELDRIGISETMRSIIREIKDAGLIKVESEINNIDGLIKKENEINLIRILQESLSNILKHSGATEVVIKLINSQSFIKLLIEDNGKGFDFDEEPENYARGLGLRGMNERANILGGSIKLESSPGKGTEINLEIPIKYDN